MKNVFAAGIRCEVHQCQCAVAYSGPLDVGEQLCEECKHPLRSHRIHTHGASAIDPTTGRMADDFEIAPSFR